MKSKVSVRTIQRIEKHENTPHGKTLQLICEALKIQPEDLLEFNQTEDYKILSWFYFGILGNIVLPLGNIILPLILWLTNRNNIIHSQWLGKHIIYNQIVISAISYPLFFVLIIGKVNHQIESWLYIFGLILFGAIHLLNFLYAIYSGVRARQGKLMKYPFFRN